MFLSSVNNLDGWIFTLSVLMLLMTHSSMFWQRQKRLRTWLPGRRMFKWIVFMQNLVQTVRSMDSQATSKHAFDTILETMAGETERRFNSIMDELFTAPKFKPTLTSLSEVESSRGEKCQNSMSAVTISESESRGFLYGLDHLEVP